MSRTRPRPPARVLVRATPIGAGRLWLASLYLAGTLHRVVLCTTHAGAIEAAGDLLREAAAEAAGLTYVKLP